MRLLWLAMFMALFQTVIFWLLSRHFHSPEKREVCWLVYFTLFTLLSLVKWGLAQWKILSAAGYGVFLVAWYVLLRKLTGTRRSRIVIAMLLALLISLPGEILAILILRKNGPEMIQAAEQIGSLGYIHGILLSYGIQLLLAFPYACIKARQKQQSQQTGKTDKEQTELLIFMLVGQFFYLLFALTLVDLQKTYVSAIWLQYLIVQVVFAAVVCGVIVKQVRDEELRDMEHRVTAMENWNRDIYQHYRELELTYRKLHHLRHDFRNLLHTACMVRQEGDAQRAKKLFADLEQMIAEYEHHSVRQERTMEENPNSDACPVQGGGTV